MTDAAHVPDAPDPLSGLRPNYHARLRKRVDALQTFVRTVSGGRTDGEIFEAGHRCVHSMISSAAIFGYAELSGAARAAEAAFELPADARNAVIRERVEHVLRIARDVLASADAGS